jgi:ABC-type nitrate/sulfonate/bicarbonate transport system ATPase subunit
MRHAGDAKQLEIVIASKAYRSARGERIEIFRDFACALPLGRLTAVLGPSGAGKTTFLRIAAGLDKDFTGHVTMSGAHRIGFVFQEPRLLPWRTLEQNVRLAAPAVGAKALRAIFTRLRLADHADLYPGELSLGLARRAAIARALAISPDVLILDEPFVSLDPPMAAALRADLGALVRERSLTALMVSHAPDDALAIADRALVFAGRPARIVGDLDVACARDLGDDALADLRGRLDALLQVASAQGLSCDASGP